MKHTQIINKISKALRLSLFGIISLVSVSIYAAKGDSKSKKGVVLKFSGFDLKAVTNFSLFSKPGFLYKGSFNLVDKAPQNTIMNSVITYQRGNTTYIYPYKHKVTLPTFKTPAPVQR